MERGFQVINGLSSIKERNAAKRALEAEGFEVEVGGYKGNYRATGYKGERPWIIRETFDLLHGKRTTTPLYRRADGNGSEYMDGTPEYPES